MTKKIGVLLCGCGHRDGSEVHETTLTLLGISKLGAEPVCIASQTNQAKVVNHQTGEFIAEKRNIAIESARISRGNIQDISKVSASNIDALIIPGGQGAGLNLSNFLIKGVKCEVENHTKRLINEMFKAKKPIGAICIAPATLAKALEDSEVSVKITIGNDKNVAFAIEKMGAKHENCLVTDCVIDKENKIVTTPAYMLGQNIAEVWSGIEKLVCAILEMI